jgi:glutamyl-tRNA synthetase
VNFVDGFLGPQSSDVAAEIGDFLVGRKGGLPAYQLAVVVDDDADGVTEVVRGDDLLPSTARQKLLQEALGAPSPDWWHVPLVVDQGGRRLAKRADDVSLFELRARGVDPRALVGWAATLSNIANVSHATASEVVSVFSFDRVSREPIVVPSSTDEFVAVLQAQR